MLLVVYTTRRSMGGNRGNGTNRSHERFHVAATDGYLRPSPLSANSPSAFCAACPLGARYTLLSAAHTLFLSWSATNLLAARIGCATQVRAIALGHVASTASGRPLSPSQHTISASAMPRLAISAHTCARKEAPSLSWTHMPGTCLNPSMSTPMAMCAALGSTLPLSRTLTLTASRYTTG